jgi:hypothetical protein
VVNQSYIFRRLLAAFLAVLLAACGGGGGEGTPAPSGLSYPKAPAFVVGHAISSLSPTVTGTMTSAASYLVTARNSGGQSNFSLTLAVQTVQPSSRFLYVSTSGNSVPGGIYAFDVDATTGALSRLRDLLFRRQREAARLPSPVTPNFYTSVMGRRRTANSGRSRSIWMVRWDLFRALPSRSPIFWHFLWRARPRTFFMGPKFRVRT